MTEDEARAWVEARVSRETSERLQSYVQFLLKWQRAINLVSPKTLTAMYSRHVADSLQVYEVSPQKRGLWLDLGSGGGFPAIVCAIAAHDAAPEIKFACVESDTRKATFLRETARHTGIHLQVINSRIEDLPPSHAQIISARALAGLKQLCDLASPHLAVDGVALFQKGRQHVAEQEDADRTWRMKREIIQSKTDPDAVIYRIGELARV